MPKKTVTSGRAGRMGRGSKLAAKSVRVSPFGVLVSTVRDDVEARMQGFFDAQAELSRAHGPSVVELVEAVRALCMRGGKRLRAGLVVVGYRSVTATDDLEPALEAGLSLELLHGYLLVHDDWMDEDDVRRGGPSVHAMLRKRYRSSHLGAAAAVLGGDLLAAMATETIARVDVPPQRLPMVLSTYAEMQMHAIAGQQLDLVGRDHDAEHTYALKTGSYTVRGPLVLGAHLAGGSAELVSALERYAMPMGIAFQHRDDLLGAFGDPVKTGKPSGSDIKAGKPTSLVMLGFEKTRGASQKALKAAWGNSRATKREVARAVDVLSQCGALTAIEARIAELTERGLSALDSPAITREGRELLTGAAEALAQRKH